MCSAANSHTCTPKTTHKRRHATSALIKSLSHRSVILWSLQIPSSPNVQAAKKEDEQKQIATYLQPHDPSATVDVCVAGCGPAGLALSAELAERGLSVCVVGPEAKFTNNYGVWVDEFKSLGLDHLLDYTWDRTLCYFADQEVRLHPTASPVISTFVFRGTIAAAHRCAVPVACIATWF